MSKLALIIVLLISFNSSAQFCKLKVTFEYINIKEGFDYQVRDDIYIDGFLYDSTKKHISSKKITHKLKHVKQGEHIIQFNNFSFYKGIWETTSIKNGYNFNGTYSSTFVLGKKNTIHVVYDVDNPPNNPSVSFE